MFDKLLSMTFFSDINFFSQILLTKNCCNVGQGLCIIRILRICLTYDAYHTTMILMMLFDLKKNKKSIAFTESFLPASII